jgi:signal transduction histidine kinase/CheY-like chemotaxis protein/streptogramin lyase
MTIVMSKWPLGVLATVLWFGLEAGASVQVPLQKYTVDDGLPQSTIYSALQDRQGYLWFGTQNGLCRFNGFEFTVFTQEKDGASEARIVGLLEDREGNIWASTDTDGLLRFDGKAWRRFTTEDGLPSDNGTGGFVPLPDGTFVAGLANGAVIWDGKAFKPFPLYEEFARRRAQGASLDRQGYLWAYFPDEGIMKYDGEKFHLVLKKDLFPEAPVIRTLADSKGRVWVSSARQGLRMWDGTALHTFRAGQGPLSDTIISLFEDRDGYVWVGTPAGVSGFSERGWISLTEKDGLPNNAVQVILQDREGNVWFGTVGGLAKLASLKFRSYTSREGLPDNSVWAIHQDTDGRILLGMNRGGLMAFDGRDWRRIEALPDMEQLPIRALLRDRRNRLWVGTGQGVALREKGRWTNAWAAAKIQPQPVFAILEDRGGRLWFATQTGIVIYDGKSWERITDAQGLPNAQVRCLFEDRDGRVWAGTIGGAAIWDGRAWKRFTRADGLAHDYVMGIAQDPKGTYWFATFGGGLSRWDGTRWTTFARRDGLSNDYCYFVLPDRGMLYVGTNQGLNRFDGKTFRVYTAHSGLASSEMNQGAVFRDRENNLWFGTVAGVTRFDPQLERPNAVAPTVVIAEVKLFDRSVPMDPPPIFRHAQNFLKFEYYGISFTSPEDVEYRHRLEGIDSDWVETRQRSIAYPNLPPGRYTFTVNARNEEGVWNKKPAIFTFIILPPFWATWWFRTLVILSAAALLVAIRRIETRAIRQRALLLKRMVQERTQELEEKTGLLEESNLRLQELDKLKSNFLSTVSHELRTPLTSIRAFSEILLDNPGEAEEKRRRFLQIISDESERLTRLIEDLLNLSRIQSGRQKWIMRPLRIAEVVETSVRVTESLVREKGLILSLELADDLPSLTGDFDKLVQVFTNLISNAVKFTPEGGSLRIGAAPWTGSGEALLHCTVADTGEGIPEDQLEMIFQKFYQVDSTVTRRQGGTGLGLAICREILIHHGGKIWAESGEGEGSTFHLLLPYHPPAIPSGEETGEPATPSRPLVLIVDDEPNIRAFIRYELEKSGYPVLEASTGEEALDLALRERPGVMLLDILLPGIDGFQVIQRLKSDPRTRDIDVVVVSILDDRERGFRLGACDYFTKPVDKERLFKTVSDLLGRRKGADGAGVLVVDDDPSTVEALRVMLQGEGYRTFEAADGPAALETARRILPDLILMDIHLPDMDGYEVIRALKADELTRHIPVIVLTASDLGRSRTKSLLLGAADYFRKPFSREEFMEGLKRVLAREKSETGPADGEARP